MVVDGVTYKLPEVSPRFGEPITDRGLPRASLPALPRAVEAALGFSSDLRVGRDSDYLVMLWMTNATVVSAHPINSSNTFSVLHSPTPGRAPETASISSSVSSCMLLSILGPNSGALAR